ncbi:MAG: hypothetical protein V1676_03405 [Candidatus Diapherotrites archaeon]
MDLSQYTKRQPSQGGYRRGMDPTAAKILGAPKYCRNCGKELNQEGKDYLFYQRFCSDSCREKYIYSQK